MIILEWDSDIATGVKSKEIENMAKKKFDVNAWTIERFIDDIPIEEFSEEEKEILFTCMIIDAVHAIGCVFEHENVEKDNLLSMKASEIIDRHSKGLSE